MALILRVVVAHKLLFALFHHFPVAVFHDGCIAGAGFLLLHFFVEAFAVYGIAVFAADEFCQVEWEAVCIEQSERSRSVKFGLSVRLEFVHVAVEQIDAFVKCAQERVFLLFHHTGNELLLGRQFGIGSTHLLHQYGHQLIHESFFPIEERVGIAHGPAQNASDHVAGLGIGRQLPIGNGEGHGAQMVGHDAHGHVDICLCAAVAVGVFIFQPRKPLYFLDDGLENVGVIVGVFALQHAHKPLEAHPGINDMHGQRLQ